MYRVTQIIACFLFSVLFSLSAYAVDSRMDLQSGIASLQSQWAKIQYREEKSHREAALRGLADEAAALSARFPRSAEPLIWEGIILSTLAGNAGPIDALGLVKDARKRLEKALELDPDALQGSAYTSLGALYYQVPGWPLSFGDKDKAGELLRKALQINPTGIDPNYFYADFLVRTDRPEEGRKYLDRARNAPLRPGRELADEGRRAEIDALLKKIGEQ